MNANENENLLQVLGNWWAKRQKERAIVISHHSDGARKWLPSRGNVLFTLVMIGFLLWAQSVGAVPFTAASTGSTGTIAYQGRLADSSGIPLTSTLNMTFRLYATASGGVAVWEEQWTGPNSVQVSDGLFNVMLGSLTPIPQNVIAANSNLFLGITVGTDSEMSPRVQLGSVPFAVQALTVPDGSVTKGKIGFPVGELLAEKTIGEGQEPVEVITISGWHPVRGADDRDTIEVTVTTRGRPLLVHMTARYKREATGIVWCGVYVYQNDVQVRRVLLDGVEGSSNIQTTGCAGSYMFTDLPAGTYTFRTMAWVDPPTTVQWQRDRQIVVIEY